MHLPTRDQPCSKLMLKVQSSTLVGAMAAGVGVAAVGCAGARTCGLPPTTALRTPATVQFTASARTAYYIKLLLTSQPVTARTHVPARFATLIAAISACRQPFPCGYAVVGPYKARICRTVTVPGQWGGEPLFSRSFWRMQVRRCHALLATWFSAAIVRDTGAPHVACAIDTAPALAGASLGAPHGGPKDAPETRSV